MDGWFEQQLNKSYISSHAFVKNHLSTPKFILNFIHYQEIVAEVSANV